MFVFGIKKQTKILCLHDIIHVNSIYTLSSTKPPSCYFWWIKSV